MTTQVWAVLIGAYLLGSISTAIVVCRVMGLPDPRSQGSKNPGATNVLRFGGKKAAAIALLGDMLKGVVPALVANAVGVSAAVLAGVGFAAFLGHLYPIFFRFQGGKGVATAFGVFLGIAWQFGLAVLATWLIMARVFKISSLSALTAAVLAPLYAWWFVGEPFITAMAVVVCVMLIWRHHSNIRNLLQGTEDTIGTDRK